MSAQSSDPESLSILALGDSLTWGYSITDDTAGGYRDPLYSLLLNDNINVNYLGVGNGNPSTTLTNAGQTANDGFNGYTVDQIDSNLSANNQPAGGTPNLGGNWLTQPGQQANVVLLMAGTNDITLSDPSLTTQQTASLITSELATLINDVHADEPNATILVASPPPVILFSSWTQDGAQLNLDLQSLIATNYAGENIDYVDMYDAINQYSDYINEDGIHLTETGYTNMADTWYNAILADYDFNADPPAPVPEPSTWALLIGGMLALFGWRRLRKA